MEPAADDAECDGDADDDCRYDSHVGIYPIISQRRSRDARADMQAAESGGAVGPYGFPLYLAASHQRLTAAPTVRPFTSMSSPM
jgi:hypothetical protein